MATDNLNCSRKGRRCVVTKTTKFVKIISIIIFQVTRLIESNLRDAALVLVAIYRYFRCVRANSGCFACAALRFPEANLFRRSALRLLEIYSFVVHQVLHLTPPRPYLAREPKPLPGNVANLEERNSRANQGYLVWVQLTSSLRGFDLAGGHCCKVSNFSSNMRSWNRQAGKPVVLSARPTTRAVEAKPFGAKPSLPVVGTE